MRPNSPGSGSGAPETRDPRCRPGQANQGPVRGSTEDQEIGAQEVRRQKTFGAQARAQQTSTKSGKEEVARLPSGQCHTAGRRALPPGATYILPLTGLWFALVGPGFST